MAARSGETSRRLVLEQSAQVRVLFIAFLLLWALIYDARTPWESRLTSGRPAGPHDAPEPSGRDSGVAGPGRDFLH